MSDLYVAALGRLAADRTTYLAHIPKDIIGIIRGMHPRTYSYEYVDAALQHLRNSILDTAQMVQTGQYVRTTSSSERQDIKRAYLQTLLHEDFRDMFIHLQSTHGEPLQYWAKMLKYDVSTDAVNLLEQLRGPAAWREVRRILWPDDPDDSND